MLHSHRRRNQDGSVGGKSAAELKAEIARVTTELNATMHEFSCLQASEDRAGTPRMDEDGMTREATSMRSSGGRLAESACGSSESVAVVGSKTDIDDAKDSVVVVPELEGAATSTAPGPGTDAGPGVDVDVDVNVKVAVNTDAALARANQVVTRHIGLLREYNDIKDVAMGLLSLIAERQGMALSRVMRQRGLAEDGE